MEGLSGFFVMKGHASLHPTGGESRSDICWEEQYREAKEFYLKNGHLDIPGQYRRRNGKQVGVWLRRQREKQKNGLLNETRSSLLRELGIAWQEKPAAAHGKKPV